jgi:hypothetical protein
MGLVGSKCFGSTFEQMNRVRAYFNLDMIGRDEPATRGRVAYFSTDSVRYADLAAEDIAAHKLDITTITDPDSLDLHFRPVLFKADETMASFFRGRGKISGGVILPENSDHAVFMRADVPVYLMTTGLHDDYHGRDDESDRIAFDKLTEISRLAFLEIRRLAND